MIEAMKNFIALHYALSQRDDNQYWRDCTNINFDIDPHWHTINQFAHGSVVTMLDKMEDAFYNLEQHSGINLYCCWSWLSSILRRYV